MTQKEERLLLSALGDSEKRAFAVLYNLYAGKCLHFISLIIKDHDVAKDINHDILLSISDRYSLNMT